MKLKGSYNLKVKKEVVWKALSDPNILKQCIPGCESFEKESETSFSATATNQIGPMNATFSGNVNLSNIKENESYTLSGEGQSPVGFANGKADINITEEKGITTLNYEVEVDVGGKIAQLGSRLIDGVAKKMSDYFFGRFADIVSPIKDNDKVTVKENRVKELQSNFLNKYVYSILFILFLLIVVIFYFVSR
tara:strand:- start:193 stop:768 length:576 start_codon:yes stop_codon:yes gene_type:complete